MSESAKKQQHRKKGTACYRCRSHKVRCDDLQPSCKNCVKAGKSCVRNGHASDIDTAEYIQQLESRVWTLEGCLSHPEPQPKPSNAITQLDGQLQRDSVNLGTRAAQNPVSASQEPDATIAAPVTASQVHQYPQAIAPGYTPSNQSAAATRSEIRPTEPLAHDVGLLSLANAQEPKYLGPSSGVPFARLILSTIPQSQGLASSLTAPGDTIPQSHHQKPEPFPLDWGFDLDIRHLADTYFEDWQPLYPFLDEEAILSHLNRVFSHRSSAQLPQPPTRLADLLNLLTPHQSVQVLLVIALGARTLEPRLLTDFASERYLATAMSRTANLLLHDSIEGLQIMLLLSLCSLCFEDGPNAWFLTFNIIAASLDLGLQRKQPWTEETDHGDTHSMHMEVRRGIFWSAYSLERTLAVVLGRPLTLRDEAIDAEFPGKGISDQSAPHDQEDTDKYSHSPKRRRISEYLYHVSDYSFRLDQLTAEMKLMLHRVNNKPDRFPWLMATDEWLQNIDQRCHTLLQEMLGDLRWRKRGSVTDSTVKHLEIKYHQCLLLLHRPSPAIPMPNPISWKRCYASAVQTIQISAELNRFRRLHNTWLTAHNIFVSGITFLYCLSTKPELRNETPLESVKVNAKACTELLESLGKTWSVAASSVSRFERLATLVVNAWVTEPTAHNGVAFPDIPQGGLSLHWQSELQAPWERGEHQVADNDALGGGANGEAMNQLLFHDHLGEMKEWFDLDWIMTAELGGLGG